jgi:hypothetical protein
MAYKYDQVIRPIKAKIPVSKDSWSKGKENNGKIVIGGKWYGRVTLPKMKGNNKDIPPGTLESIRKQLLLCHDQFVELIKCPMTTSDYIKKITSKTY